MDWLPSTLIVQIYILRLVHLHIEIANNHDSEHGMVMLNSLGVYILPIIRQELYTYLEMVHLLPVLPAAADHVNVLCHQV